MMFVSISIMVEHDPLFCSKDYGICSVCMQDEKGDDTEILG